MASAPYWVAHQMLQELESAGGLGYLRVDAAQLNQLLALQDYWYHWNRPPAQSPRFEVSYGRYQQCLRPSVAGKSIGKSVGRCKPQVFYNHFICVQDEWFGRNGGLVGVHLTPGHSCLQRCARDPGIPLDLVMSCIAHIAQQTEMDTKKINGFYSSVHLMVI